MTERIPPDQLVPDHVMDPSEWPDEPYKTFAELTAEQQEEAKRLFAARGMAVGERRDAPTG
jgi:hypothetical protein